MDTSGLWDEMHCTNNAKNFACQIPAGNEGVENVLQKKPLDTLSVVLIKTLQSSQYARTAGQWQRTSASGSRKSFRFEKFGI